MPLFQDSFVYLKSKIHTHKIKWPFVSKTRFYIQVGKYSYISRFKFSFGEYNNNLYKQAMGIHFFQENGSLSISPEDFILH